MTEPDSTRVEAPATLVEPTPEESFGPGSAVEAAQQGLFGRGMLFASVFFLQTAAAVVVSPILAHRLGPGGFGELAAALATFQVLTVVAVLGMDKAITIQVAEDRHDLTGRGLLTVSMSLAVGLVGVAALTSPLWSSAAGLDRTPGLIGVTLLWIGLCSALQTVLALLMAQDRLGPFAAITATGAVGGQVLGLGAVFLWRADTVSYLWGTVLAQVIAVVAGVAVTRPRLRGLAEVPAAVRAVQLGGPLMAGGLAAVVLNSGDRFVINSLLGPDSLGRYQVAYTIGFILVMMVAWVTTAWVPRYAMLADVSDRMELARRARGQLHGLAVPMVVGVTLAAPLALRIFAPSSFSPDSLPPLVLLVAISVFPYVASSVTTMELVVLRRGRGLAVVAAAAAVLNIGLNFLLIPVAGLNGSALATVIALTFVAVMQDKVLLRGHAWPAASRKQWALIVVSSSAAACTLLLPPTPLWIGVRFVGALVCVPWVLWRLKLARKGA